MSDDEEYVVAAPDLAEDDPMRHFLPAAFGKQKREANIAAQIEQTKRKVDKPREKATDRLAEDGPAERPHGGQEAASKDWGSDSDSDSDSDEDDEYPVSHELVLKTHERAVTTTTLDPSGSRLVTGSTDCMLRFHDFASMTPTTLRAFKTIDPHDSKTKDVADTHPINAIEFNPISGSMFLCVTEHPQVKIMNRDGAVKSETVKGDMYLRDMHNTKGHISAVTSGTWNPTHAEVFVTAGTDSTLRIWDVNYRQSQKSVLVYKSKTAGNAGRSKMTAVAWGSPVQGGNNILVAAALDGALVMWSSDGAYNRPTAEIRSAHTPDTWTSGIDISHDGRTVVTRGGDNLIKLWDTRKFKAPVVTVSHPSTGDHYPTANIKYAPNSTSIITGSSTGHLHILNPGNLKPELVTPVTAGSPLITVQWHDKLNQIITGSANAEVHVLYNPNTSQRGAKDVMSRAPKKRHIDDNPEFTTDQSLGQAGDEVGQGHKEMSYAARHPNTGMTASGRSRDPRRPHMPTKTPFSKSQADEAYIKESIPLSSMRDEDPREALLKYADIAEKNPLFTNAWSKTQPKTQYAELSDDDDDGPDKKKAKR